MEQVLLAVDNDPDDCSLPFELFLRVNRAHKNSLIPLILINLYPPPNRSYTQT